MKNTTAPSTVANAMADYFLPRLLECEDFDAFEGILAKDSMQSRDLRKPY